MPLLFVYGTLRRGERYHHYLGGARFIAPAESLKSFEIKYRAPPDDPEGYPVAIESGQTGACKISGELYEIDEETLKAVDELENYPAEYARKEYAFTAEGEKYNALMYVGRNDDA